MTEENKIEKIDYANVFLHVKKLRNRQVFMKYKLTALEMSNITTLKGEAEKRTKITLENSIFF